MADRKKATDEVLFDAYNQLRSIDRVAALVGMSRAGVHLRLKKMPGYSPLVRKRLTDAHKSLITQAYASGFSVNDGTMATLVAITGHTKQFICRYANEEGLTDRTRPGAKWKLPPKPPKIPKPYVHPRGMLGKSHSKDSRSRMSVTRLANPQSEESLAASTLKGMQTKVMRYGSVAGAHENIKRSWKSAWRVIGGIRKFYRSRWEANYARVLQWRLEQGMISAWQHEPETFWFLAIKRGVRSYLPDFRVTNIDGSIEYHEVKGWMDDRSRVKLQRMEKYYPEVAMILIEAAWFKANKNFRIILKDWESSTS